MYKELEANTSHSTLTNEDIKKLRYFLHPDKHQGKSNDLWVKLGNINK